MENDASTMSEHNVRSSNSGRGARGRTVKIAVGIVGLGVLIAGVFYSKSLIMAATVDGSIITRLGVIRQLEKQGGKNVLESLITEKLIEHEAAKKAIVISDDEVTQGEKAIEANIAQQGGTLKDALLQKGLTEEDLKKQIKIQKKVEKLLADKIGVTQDEVTKFMTDNKVVPPKGKEAETKTQVEAQLRNQKLGQEAQKWIAALKSQAKITHYVDY